jgi:hypothetical protein
MLSIRLTIWIVEVILRKSERSRIYIQLYIQSWVIVVCRNLSIRHLCSRHICLSQWHFHIHKLYIHDRITTIGVGSNPIRDLEFFNVRNYLACLRNIGFSTQVAVRAWNNAKRGILTPKIVVIWYLQYWCDVKPNK